MQAETTTPAPEHSSVMPHPAVVVHGMADVRLALQPRRPVLLLSAPGAALYAGCGFWLALMELAREEFRDAEMHDALDCGDASGLALGAIRIGQRTLVLNPNAPGFAAVAAIAARDGVVLLATRPAALDLLSRGAARRLGAWLTPAQGDIDSGA